MAGKDESTKTYKSKPTCFMAMPISVVDPSKYRDDQEHFEHVMKWLFEPAIEAAGFEPISPIGTGADIIHAGIVEQLQTADLVLADISTLNANVFFELGIRISLDRPVCMVMDDLVKSIPFDMNAVNHHKYKSTLLRWEIDNEITKLTKHIKASVGSTSKSMWKILGMKTKAQEPNVTESPTDAKLSVLLDEIRQLREEAPSYMRSLEDASSSIFTVVYVIDQVYMQAKIDGFSKVQTFEAILIRLQQIDMMHIAYYRRLKNGHYIVTLQNDIRLGNNMAENFAHLFCKVGIPFDVVTSSGEKLVNFA